MNFSLLTLLVTVVFISQLLVMSFVVPRAFRHMFAELGQRYPPEQYPRLYPVPIARMRRVNTLFNILNVLLGLSGAAALAWGLVHSFSAERLADWMIWTSMAQYLPALLRIPWQLHIRREIRKLPPPPVRMAQLRSWQVSDFVSHGVVVAGFICTALAIVSSALIYFLAPIIGITSRPYPLLYMATLSGLLLWRMTYVASGRATLSRPDPFMSEAGVFRARQLRLRMLFRVSILIGTYFTLTNIYFALGMPFNRAHGAMLVSLLIQANFLWIWHLSRQALEVRDVHVYQADPA